MTPVKSETAVKTETLRKSSFSETTRFTFATDAEASSFFEWLPICEFIGEWKKLDGKTVTVFNCSAD